MTTIKEQVVNELHKPARKKFMRRRVIVKGLNDLLQADLVEMQPYSKFNRGYRYILVVINVFSKYVWAEPVKTKSGKDVAAAMKTILHTLKTNPQNLQTDRGTEFFNQHFQKLMERFKINHYSTFSNLKASVVERVNRTLKTRMWKMFSLQGNYRWLNILQDIVKDYNNTKHSTIAMKPNQVNKQNEKKILRSIFTHAKTVDSKLAKFKVGDHVRISKYREAFSKGYTPNWSNEIFRIKKVKMTNPRTYIIEDERNEEIQGGFYEQELQKAKHSDVYLVEKILRRKGNKVYVKWLGLDKKFNTWINKNDVL